MGTHTLRAMLTLAALGLALASADISVHAQAGESTTADYIIGPQDVLTITCYDQADLTGKFTVEADGTFTYPLIGRFKAGSLTLRQLEESLRKRLKDEGYFRNPQVSASVELYKSQKVFIVGEVHGPGMYPLSGNMSLVEVIARAGSTLPTSSGEAIIVHAGAQAAGPTLPTQDNAGDIVRVSLRELENGVFSQNATLRDGDTIFVPRAETIYVFGQVKNPGAYALPQKRTTVLQALSIAGGVTDRGAMNRIQVVRIVNGNRTELAVKPADILKPGDTVVVRERFF